MQLVHIRECGGVLYLGMATEILKLCITRIMSIEATNPKPSMQREWYCLAVHKKILANVPLSTRELRNRPSDFIAAFFLSFFLLSRTKLLTSIAYKTKAVIELIHTQNGIAFVVVAPFSPFVCNWQEWWFWLATVLRSSNKMPFLATQKVEVQMCAYCACTVHMQTHLTAKMVVFEVLTKSLSIQHLVAHDH